MANEQEALSPYVKHITDPPCECADCTRIANAIAGFDTGKYREHSEAIGEALIPSPTPAPVESIRATLERRSFVAEHRATAPIGVEFVFDPDDTFAPGEICGIPCDRCVVYASKLAVIANLALKVGRGTETIKKLADELAPFGVRRKA